MIWHPSLVVNFKIHFDEKLVVLTSPMPKPLSLDETVNQRVLLQAHADTEPLILQKGIDSASFIYNRIPKRASVELPGYRQAGQFSLDIDFEDLPIDPRAVRNAAVEIHLGAVSPDDFGRGVTQHDSHGQRSSIIKTRNADGSVNQDTMLMVGVIDDWSVDTSSNGSVVSMKGRDLRGLLIDAPVSLAVENIEDFFADIDTSETIDQCVSDILYTHPAFRLINVVCDANEWPGGEIPAPWTKSTTARHRHGATGKKAVPRSTPQGELGKTTFWDLIIRLCYFVGAIPYFRGTDLVIRPTRSIFDQANAGSLLNPTPFKSERSSLFGAQPRRKDAQSGAAIDPPLRFRRMAYGRDMEALSFDRKFAGYERPKMVRVVCVDGSSKVRGRGKLLTATYPPMELATKLSPGGKVAESEFLNIPVTGLTDVAQLATIAEGVYEEIGRGELGGSCSTPNLASFGGDNADPDLLRLKPGDGVEFVNDISELRAVNPLVSTVTDHYRAPFADEVRQITKRLGDENLARVIVATSRGAIQQVQRFFRTSTVKYAWSEKGIKIDFDFQNYIVVRNQIGDRSFAFGHLATSTSSGAGAPTGKGT